jgi:hypothetical protein
MWPSAKSLRYFNEAAAIRPGDPEPQKGAAEMRAVTHEPESGRVNK